MVIEFTRKHTTEGEKPVTYEHGWRYEVPNAQAKAFINAGVARKSPEPLQTGDVALKPGQKTPTAGTKAAEAKTPADPPTVELFGQPLAFYEGKSDAEIKALPGIDKAGLKVIRDAQAAAAK